jgi:MoaA/NifB/PqqE/SkfB family radical SAM enzyme
MLSPALLTGALETLREEGFNVVSISGGEPLLYKALFEVLRFARQLDMTVTLTSNGMLLNEATADQLAETAHLIAISLDGIPDSHDRMRSHPGAFEKMARNLEFLRKANIPFAFIFALTLYNLHELAWVAEFAVAQGASVLQVHPLEEEGRAGEELGGAAPDELELAHAFVEIARLQALYSGQLTIQFDAADRHVIAADPLRAYAMAPVPQAVNLKLGALMAPLVLEHDGSLVPMQYGVSRAFQIANIMQPDFCGQITRWKAEGYPKLLELCVRVYERALDPSAYRYPYFNWYSALLRGSHADRLAQIA